MSDSKSQNLRAPAAPLAGAGAVRSGRRPEPQPRRHCASASHAWRGPGGAQRAVESINRRLEQSVNNLRFSVDDDTGKVVVKVLDTATDQVIRQIPSEEALAISRSLEKLQGLLLNQQA